MSRLIRSFFILLILVPSMMAGFTLVGAQDDATQIEIVGVIDAMTSSSITINGLVIDISVAEINTPLAVGTQVKVQGSLAAGGLIVAREVNDPLGNGTGDDDTPNPVDELEIRGVLSAINGTLYTIGGQVVDGSLAEVKAGVVVGAVVKAHASVSADGTWVAREIEGISPDDDDFSDVTQLEYVGTLNAIGADSVLVDALTFITVNAQMSPALMVGIRVKVEGTVVDGVLVAREVRPATADDNSNDNSDDNGNDDNGNGNSSDDNGNDDNGNDDNGNDNVAVCPPVMPNGWTTYTVRAGDSLSRIAQITDTDFDDLVAVNCITNPSTIFVGQVLFVENAARSGGGSDDNGNSNSNSNDNGDDDNGNDDGSNSNSNDNGDDDNDDNGNDNGDNGNDDSGSDDDDD
jgi:LysM repeat protein